MIETIQWNQPSAPPVQSRANIFRMTSHERTAGSMPVWEKPETPKQQVLQDLNKSYTDSSVAPHRSSYSAQDFVQPDEAFTFGDLLDMVNPLHHIPLVNIAYRKFTGDTIKPIGSIVGGAVFGGGVGAASGVVNAVIQHETGKGIGDNAIAMVTKGEMPTFHVASAPSSLAVPENARQDCSSDFDLTQDAGLIKEKAQEDMTLALLSFSNLKEAMPMPIKTRTPIYNS